MNHPAACIPDQYVMGNSHIMNRWIAHPQLIVQPPSCARPQRPQQIWYQKNPGPQYCRPAPPPLIFYPHHSQNVQRPPVTPVQPTPAVMPSAFNNRATLQYFPTAPTNSQVQSHICNCFCCQSNSCCCHHHSYLHSIVPYHGTSYHCNDNICYPQQQTIFQSCTRQTKYVNQNASNTTNTAPSEAPSDYTGPGFIVQEIETRQVQAPNDDLHARLEVLTPTDSDSNGAEEIDGIESQPEKRPRVEASPPYSPQSLIIDLDLGNDSLNDKLPFEDFIEDRNSNNNNNSNLVTEHCILVSEPEDSIEGKDALSTEVLSPQKDGFVEEAAMNCTRVQDGDKVFDNDTEQQEVTCSRSSELNVSVAEEISKSNEIENQEPVQSGNQCKTASVEEVMEFGISEVSVYEIPSPKNDAVEVEELQCAINEAASIVSFPPVDDSTNLSSPDSLNDSTNLSPPGSFNDSTNHSPPDSLNDSSHHSPPDSFDGPSSNHSPPGSFDGPSNLSSPALMDDDPSYSDIDELSGSDTDDEFFDLSLSLDEDDSSISSPPALIDESSNSSPPPMDKSSSPLVISIPLSVLDYDASTDNSASDELSPLIVSYPISVWLGRKKQNENNDNSSIEESKSRLNKILDSSALLSPIDLYILKGFFLNTLPKMEKEVLRYALTHYPATANSKAFYIGIKLNLTTREWISFKQYGDSLDVFDNSIDA